MNQGEMPKTPGFSSSSSSSERLAEWLVHRAARRAPDSLAERLEEEWRADLAARTSPSSRLRFAIGCTWATRVIAREFAVPVPVANTAVVGGVTAHPFAQGQSRRTATFILVAGLHIAVLYGFIAVGTKVFQPKPIPPFQTSVIEPPSKTPPPPIVPPKPITETLSMDPPDRPKYVDSDTADPPIVDDPPVVHDGPPSPPLTVDPPGVHRVMGGPGSGFPDTEDFYPSASKRIGEQGVVQVQVCVNPDGRLGADPTLAASSGFARLDEGALRLAKAASGHYRPSTEDGRAVSSCYPYKIRFRMKDT
jgi:periplasmic protein TonB